MEDDSLSFLSETIRVERIRDEEGYEGVRVLLEARLGNVRIPLQIDVGFGDSVVPAPEKLEFPTLLKFPAPRLNAYPKESVVAEKFEAIVKLGMANSRMKDFYDLWVLAQRFEFERATLASAIEATFKTRRTTLPSSLPLAFTADFHQLSNKQTQWKAFLRKSGLNANSSLEEGDPCDSDVCHARRGGDIERKSRKEDLAAGRTMEIISCEGQTAIRGYSDSFTRPLPCRDGDHSVGCSVAHSATCHAHPSRTDPSLNFRAAATDGM